MLVNRKAKKASVLIDFKSGDYDTTKKRVIGINMTIIFNKN